MELVLVFVLGGVPFIKAGGRDHAALEGNTAAKHRLFRHRFGAAINDIVSAHPECSETTITYDYEDGHTWASYWPEVLAIFAVHTNLNSDSDVVVINAAQMQRIQDISFRACRAVALIATLAAAGVLRFRSPSACSTVSSPATVMVRFPAL